MVGGDPKETASALTVHAWFPVALWFTVEVTETVERDEGWSSVGDDGDERNPDEDAGEGISSD